MEYLDFGDILLEELEVFLGTLFCGDLKKLATKLERIVLSVGQDICRQVTNCKWKLPKHVLLVMTLRLVSIFASTCYDFYFFQASVSEQRACHTAE